MKRVLMQSDRVVFRSHMKLLVLLVLACLPSAFAQTVSVAWNPNGSEDAVTGYNLYYGVTGNAPNKIILGTQTSTTISGVQPALTYFFYVTAVNASGESDPSELVEYRLNQAPLASNLS